MIINAVLQVVLWLLELVLSQVEVFGDEPTEAIALVVGDVITLIVSGCRILAAYTDFSYLLILLGLVLIINAFHTGYKVVLWILRKIPFLNIS